MPFQETAAFHPWDRATLFVGAFVVGFALWGVIDAPLHRDGGRFWRRRFLRAGAALAILSVALVGYHAYRGISTWRDLGGYEAPVDVARAAIPALEYLAAGWIGILGLATADLLAVSAAARSRALPLVGAVLLGLPAVPSLFAPERILDGFVPIPPLPLSAEWVETGCLFGMLGAGLVCIAGLARMSRHTGESDAARRARVFGLRAAVAEFGIAAVYILLHWTEVLANRAMLGPLLTTSLWGDLYRSVAGNLVIKCALLVGTAAATMAGIRRRGDGGTEIEGA